MSRVDFVPAMMPTPHRVAILGSATQGWYEASDAERAERILPRFKALLEEWKDLGARILATLDDDLFMVGPPGHSGYTWYLILEVDRLDSVVEMLQRVRAEVDGVRMDAYVRFEARIGRPLFLAEP